MDIKPVPDSGFYKTAFNLTVLIAGLGYFVDTFDFFLFLSMRVPSLTDLGLTTDQITRTGLLILDGSILGAMIGSLFWGVLGDKVGRKKALLGSILIYSLGMVANAFVHDALTYAFVRFFIGFGVAGELGLGTTLVAETVHSSKRTYALTFFAAMGVFGVAIAAISLEFVDWRTSCLIGGGLGLLLLLLRSLLYESSIFLQTVKTGTRRGSLRDLFGSLRNLKTFACCVLVLAPNYYLTGFLLALSPEISKFTDVQGTIKANIALAVYFTVSVLGDFVSAWLSERFKSRRLVAGLFVLGNAVLALVFIQKLGLSPLQFYVLCAVFGLFNLWAISGTIVVEQFPTTLRATASTASLNFSRGTVILTHMAFLAFKSSFGVINVSFLLGTVIIGLGIIAIWQLPETYGRSLKGTETVT